MIKETMEKALNDQINAELYSGYLYLSMSAYFESISLPGMANWMRTQASEEQFHGMKMYDYLNEAGGRAKLMAIEEPKFEWDGPLDVFEAVLEHEQKVTSLINDLVDLAFSQKDHATYNMLQWFIAEQVEEESNASDLVGKMKLIKDDPSALFMMDQELAKRVFTPPAKE